MAQRFDHYIYIVVFGVLTGANEHQRDCRKVNALSTSCGCAMSMAIWMFDNNLFCSHTFKLLTVLFLSRWTRKHPMTQDHLLLHQLLGWQARTASTHAWHTHANHCQDWCIVYTIHLCFLKPLLVRKTPHFAMCSLRPNYHCWCSFGSWPVQQSKWYAISEQFRNMQLWLCTWQSSWWGWFTCDDLSRAHFILVKSFSHQGRSPNQ